MISNKNNKRKVWKIIIIILLSIIIVFFAMTKIIYDACFLRYDAEAVMVPEELSDMVAHRQGVTFLSGENELQGYLYSGNKQQLSEGQAGDLQKESAVEQTAIEEYGIGENGIEETAIEGTGLVVMAPGYHASADNYLWQIQSFLEYGWDVFIFDTTGSCESEGKSSVGFSQELWDLDAALDYVEANYEYDYLFLFGHSRGGYAVCGILGSEHDITAVVSVSGINSAMEGIMEPAVRYAGPMAYSNYPLLWLYQVSLFDEETVEVQADEEISNSRIPTLIVQGNADDIVPMEESSIYSHRDEITSEYVEYYVCDIPGQNGHRSLMFDEDGTANDTLMQEINEFYYNIIIQD